ncbi:MAG TPA: hypothetical protein VF395_12060 [Polyangiaceae bacterium]
MQAHALKARIENGRVIVEEMTNLPDGEIYVLPLQPDEVDDPELIRELEASIEDEEAGRLVDADVVMARLGSRV